ncbi:MAG TPA: CHC2 zinc finger domain-containing protein [Gallionellaceae bacterium]|nr:CHC2 zinc finger domain-containing protein [Gallionellaceae bacterium]HQS76683.1 CHC2 zinc finger domain-containing protein [Gallionellaceae bacterium]
MQQAASNTNAVFQDVKRAADLADYIEAHSTSKRTKKGASIFFEPAPCCSHKDCFSLFDGDTAYKCHSCGLSGDVFNFAQDILGMSTGDALREVASFAGVTLPDRKKPADSASSAGTKPKPDNRLQQVLEATIAHYQAALAERADVMEWLTAAKPQGRGHKVATLKLMEVGCADGKLAEALGKQGFSLDEVKAAGLYVESKKTPGVWRDFFVPGMVLFPHRLPSGEVAHFTLKDPQKKLDYQLRTENRLDGFLWGNQKAIRGEVVIAIEGENDLASFFDAGYKNALASLGQLSDAQIQWLDAQASGKTVITWFDYDTKWGENGQPPAGMKYTRKTYQRLLRNTNCKVLVASGLMEPGEDPDDWIQKDMESAPKRIQSVLKKAMNPLLWELRVMPADVKEDADACLRYLTEIDYFEFFSLLPELQRDAVIVEMQKLGFSRDGIMGQVKDTYGLLESLVAILDVYNGSTKSDNYKRDCSAAVWDYFRQRGRFFVSGERLCLFYQHTIYTIGDNVPFKALMHREAGLNIKMEVSGFIMEELKALTYSRGDKLSEFGWISLLADETGPVLYLNLKDAANRILKVSCNSVDIAENGTNPHNVLLAESSQMKAFRYDPDVNIAQAMHGIKSLVLDSMACDASQRYLLLAWALSAFLMPITSAKALMKLEGGSGSGKTSAAEVMSLMLYGENMVGRSSTASDYSMAATEPLIIKDNLETDDMNRNSLNFLLLAATGATNIKREQGTQSGVVTEKINCLVAITAIEPFSKPELINRAFIVDFHKKYQRIDFVKDDNARELLAKRDDMLSAWLLILAEKVLPSLGDRAKIIQYIREHHKDFSKDRVSEYLALLVLITRALLKYMPLSNELKLDAGDRQPEYVLLDAWVKYQNEHARMAEQGTNAVLQLIEGLRRVFLIEYSRKQAEAVAADGTFGINQVKLWVELMGVTVWREEVIDGANELKRKQTYYFDAGTQELLSMLNRYGREYGVKVPFSNARQLGVRIANELDTLKRAGWAPSQLKVVHGNRITRWQWTDGGEE